MTSQLPRIITMGDNFCLTVLTSISIDVKVLISVFHGTIQPQKPFLDKASRANMVSEFRSCQLRKM